MVRIGDAAAQLGVSERALRYYEEQGLVSPASIHELQDARAALDAIIAAAPPEQDPPERPPPGQRHPRTTTRSSTDSKRGKVMDPQEIAEEPQERTGSWMRRHDEHTPQELAGGRS